MAAISMGRTRSSDPGAPTESGPSTGSAIFGTVARCLATVLAACAEHAYRRVLEYPRLHRDARRLAQLDDRMLRDIGVSRAEIASAVYGRKSGERRCDARY